MTPHPDRATRRRRDERGQAMVEFVLVLPVVALLMGVAFNGWSGMQLSIGLTSAARAGAIQAANELAADPNPTGAQIQTAWNAATMAVNAEEGTNNTYQNTDSAAADYVSMSVSTQGISGGASINVVTVTISGTSFTLIPLVKSVGVTAHASARFS
jgi:Flp pilus assembly protein TadG